MNTADALLSSSSFVFVHTVKMSCQNYEIFAHFYHSLTLTNANSEQHVFHLLGKRIAIKQRRQYCHYLPIIDKAHLKTCMKSQQQRHIRHRLRALNIGGRNNYITNNLIPQSYVKGEESQITTATNLTIQQQQQQSQSSASCTQNQTILDTVDNKPQSITINNSRFGTNFSLHHLSTDSTSNETSEWLTTNRFSAYLRTFNNFSGADILRLSRDDLIQICGLADGIRLYNALHAKIVSPKLTLYVSTEQSNVFNAVYLSTYSICELSDKLSRLIIQTSRDQVQGYYIQGPNGIHIHINDEVVRHLKNETMYSMELINDITTCQCRILLKPFNCN